jgi:hypothetical protein
MVRHLFPDFLDDKTAYDSAEAFWRNLWDEMLDMTGQRGAWRTPWLNAAFASGTPFRDGDPIFSALCPRRRLGVRVIQHEPEEDGPELDTWVDWSGDEWSDIGRVRVLVLSCALSEEVVPLLRDRLYEWLRAGKVHLVTDPERLLCTIPA